MTGRGDREEAKKLKLALLQCIYMKQDDPETDFYEQFEERMGAFAIDSFE